MLHYIKYPIWMDVHVASGTHDGNRYDCVAFLYF